MNLGVVIPTTPGREEAFLECLKSVIACDPFEIVVVTPYPAGLKSAMSQYPEVKVLEDSGVGAAAAINIGLRSLESSFGAWIGDDDKLVKSGISESLARLQVDAQVVATYGQVFYVGDSGRVLYKPGARAAKTPGRVINRIPQPGSVFRRLQSGQFMSLNESLRFAFDEQLFIDLRQVGAIEYICQPVAEYLWHAGSLSLGQRRDAIREAILLRWRVSSVVMRLLLLGPWLFLWLDSAIPSAKFARVVKGSKWSLNEK
jgi:hypothetical protein